MLELLGVDKSTPDPGPLETFVRDAEGNPTGWVREFAWEKFADNMWNALNWRPPEDLTPESLKGFFDFLGDSGITAIADGFIENDAQIRSIYEWIRPESFLAIMTAWSGSGAMRICRKRLRRLESTKSVTHPSISKLTP
jgi:predicted amidohydrolase YtcJ